MVERANMTHEEVEEGQQLALDFGKLQRAAACGEGLVPVAAQDVDSGEVLILAYANEEAVNYTRREGVAAFWSTSRNELWVKGATSGNVLELVEIRVNCEQNSLLYRVRLKGEGPATLWTQMVGRGRGVTTGGSWGTGSNRFELLGADCIFADRRTRRWLMP